MTALCFKKKWWEHPVFLKKIGWESKGQPLQLELASKFDQVLLTRVQIVSSFCYWTPWEKLIFFSFSWLSMLCRKKFKKRSKMLKIMGTSTVPIKIG